MKCNSPEFRNGFGCFYFSGVNILNMLKCLYDTFSSIISRGNSHSTRAVHDFSFASYCRRITRWQAEFETCDCGHELTWAFGNFVYINLESEYGIHKYSAGVLAGALGWNYFPHRCDDDISLALRKFAVD